MFFQMFDTFSVSFSVTLFMNKSEIIDAETGRLLFSSKQDMIQTYHKSTRVLQRPKINGLASVGMHSPFHLDSTKLEKPRDEITQRRDRQLGDRVGWAEKNRIRQEV